MNDPNGLIQWRGRYHLFYQYNPNGAFHGTIHWGHAVSDDLVHWRDLPVALAPTPGGPDKDGVYSGCALDHDGVPTLMFTGVRPQVQCIAEAADPSDPDLIAWRKHPNNPIIPDSPVGLDVEGFRDPFVWREGDDWYCVIGSGVKSVGGNILLYRSSDLVHWEYLHELCRGDIAETGRMWECPNFFPLGDKHVLLISTMGKVRWKVGTYANQRFTPEKEGVVDWGSYYAAKTMLAENGNRILWGWITEARPDAELIAAGWAGAMSLPRTMSLNKNGDFQSEVAPPAQRLRAAHSAIPATMSPAGKAKKLDAFRIRDLAAELDLQLQPKSDNFALRLQSDGGDFVTISCSAQSGRRELRVNNVAAPLGENTSARVAMHLFLDGSVLELFVNGTTSLTARIYKIPAGPLHLKLESAELVSLNAWQLTPISKDRLTSSLCS